MQMRQSRSRLMALLLAGLMLFSSLAVLAGCACLLYTSPSPRD